MTALPSPVGCVNATCPFLGSSTQPCIDVLAAAESSLLAMPCRRCALETNRRGMPSGVGRGSGWQNIPVSVSTTTRDSVFVDVGELVDSASPWGSAIAIAVEILSAMTHPTIFSRVEATLDARTRKRNALDACKVSRLSAGDDSVKLIVSNSVDSCKIS